MIEMEDFLAQHEIFEQRRTALAGFQRILIIRNPVTEIVGEIGRAPRALIAGVLMKLAALAGDSLDCRRAGARGMIAERVFGGRRRGEHFSH